MHRYTRYNIHGYKKLHAVIKTHIQNRKLSSGFCWRELKKRYIVYIIHNKGVTIIAWIKIEVTVRTVFLI